MMTAFDVRLFSDDSTIRRVGEGLLARTLPRAEWTHEAHLAAWQASPERAQQLHRVTGLDYWFATPHSTTRPAPPRWKVATVTWLGIFPTVLLLFLTVAPLMEGWYLVPRVMVITVLVVLIMTWGVAPRLTRWLHPWLHAKG